MADISLSVQAGDADKLVRAMDKLQSELGMTPGEAVKAGAFAVARALSAATRVAPKRRKVAAVKTEDGLRTRFVAIKPGKTGDKEIPIRAENIAAARADPRARIKLSGLAKAVWLHTARKTSGGSLGGKDVAGAERASHVVRRLQRHDAEIQMTNRLKYTSDAFKTKGRATLDNAMSRAANGMAKYLERKTKKTVQQLGLA